jgi:hypothetical protein
MPKYCKKDIMNKNLKVYIATSDSNIFIIKYFQYFFNKYFSNKYQVKILGFSKPKFKLEKNFKFVSLAPKQIGGVDKWSDYIINYFEDLTEKFFIFGIDDFMIVRPVDFKVLNTSEILMKKFNLGRVDLQPVQYAKNTFMFKKFKYCDDIQFKEIKKKFFLSKTYLATGAFSIWKRKFFLKSLEKNMSPWKWEIYGTKKLQKEKEKVVCSWNISAIKKIELLSNKSWPGYINTKGIRKEDVNHMKKLVNQNDRIKKFKEISSLVTGYSNDGKDEWINKIFGK